MSVRLDGRFHSSMDSPLPQLGHQITGRMVVWPSFEVVNQVLVETPEMEMLSVETPVGTVVMVAVTLVMLLIALLVS